jgi:hypothetical protein
VVAGVLLFAATMAVSAVTAPDRDVSADEPTVSTTGSTAGEAVTPTEPASRDRVLLGVQGGGPEWREHGQVGLLEDGEIQWRVSDADSYFDVTRLADGRIVAGFMHGGYESGCDPYDAPCTKSGIRIVDPTGPGEPTTRTVFTMPVFSPVNSEIHDVEPLGEGRYLFTDMEYERVAVAEDGEVVWEWNASSFYDAPDHPTRQDWLHINDVDVLSEGRYLVSVRNANQLLVIERGAGVVEVINEDRGTDDAACTEHPGIADHDDDGAVRCGDPDVIDEQHNPQWLGDGAVLIADSENDRVVELHRNGSGVWEPRWALTEAGGIAFNWPRDADRLPNGNTLLTDSLNKRVLVVDRDGGLVWSHATDRIPYEADPDPAGEYPGQSIGAMTDTPTASTGTDDSNATATPTADGLATAAANQSADVAVGEDVPGLSLLLVGAKAIAPWLPVWFGELQLGATLVSLGLVAGGGVARWRGQASAMSR